MKTVKPLALACLLTLTALPAWAVAATAVSGDAPAEFAADRVSYDRNRQQIRAEGHVEVTREGRVLKADQVVYTESTRKVVASGNVSLREVTGETLYADSIEVTDDLKEGLIERVRVLFADQSRFLAARGTRTPGPVNTLEKAAFTPCPVCGDADPLWEIQASRIVHDEIAREISYRNATLAVLGVPVFWLPRFTHPDPTVERKTGLLVSSFGRSSDRGLITRTPYYFALSPSRDVTLTPVLMTRAGGILAQEYRQRFASGELEIKGSAGRVREVAEGEVKDSFENAAHLNAKGQFALTDAWRWRFGLDRVSHRAYLRRFDFSNADILTSELAAERLQDRSFLSLNSYAFQGLRPTDNNDAAPLVTPEITYDLLTQRDSWGGFWNLDASSLVLTRQKGVDSRRVSFGGAWERPWVSALGETRLTASLQSDFYNVSDVADPDTAGRLEDASTARVLPQLRLTQSLPFIRTGERVTQVITPQVGVVVGPNGMNPDKIPNEDSQAFEFDTTNLFSLNRFAGRDRVDSGQRVDFGVGYDAYGLFGADLSAFAGQSVRLNPSNAYGAGSGLDEKQSDYVGRWGLVMGSTFDLLQQVRFDKDDLSLARNEISVGVLTSPVQFYADYLYTTDAANDFFGGQEEVAAQVSTLLPQNWVLSGQLVHDLAEDQLRYGTVGLSYFVQCAAFTLQVERDLTDDPLTSQETAVMFRLDFRHLGQGNLTNWLRQQNRLTGKPRTVFEGGSE